LPLDAIVMAGAIAETDTVGREGRRRPSIEKRPVIHDDDSDGGYELESAFDRLPDEIIQQYGHVWWMLSVKFVLTRH
jgi:hypothetical protein